MASPQPSQELQENSSVDIKLLPEENSTSDVVTNLVVQSPEDLPQGSAELLLNIPGAIVNLIDKEYSVELACGDLSIVRLQNDSGVLGVAASVGDEIQWLLNKEHVAVKLDDSHYFFSTRSPKDSSDEEDEEKDEKDGIVTTDDPVDADVYGLTIAMKGQEELLVELDNILKTYSCFSDKKVSGKANDEENSLIELSSASDISPDDLTSSGQKELVEGKCSAYWTALAPNVEEYSNTAARLITKGSAQMVKGILWSGDVAVTRMTWVDEVMKKRMNPKSKSQISPATMKRIRRVKRATRATEKVVTGVICGVVKVSESVKNTVGKSKVGSKLFSLPGMQIVVASVDGFNKVCDAVEVAGTKVMTKSSAVTTKLVAHRYGEEAAEATKEGLDAAGGALGTASAAFNIRKAFNPKGVLKSSNMLAKSAAKTASDLKAKCSITSK